MKDIFSFFVVYFPFRGLLYDSLFCLSPLVNLLPLITEFTLSSYAFLVKRNLPYCHTHFWSSQ